VAQIELFVIAFIKNIIKENANYYGSDAAQKSINSAGKCCNKGKNIEHNI